MDYYLLTDLAVTMGYHLAMSGAETFRVEDTVHRILRAYGVECEVFAIPNSISVSLEAANGKPLMLMKRIDFHGNDLEAMEKLNALSRRICTERPEVDEAMTWLHETLAACRTYRTGVIYLGGVLVGLGFCLVFGGTLLDCLWANIAQFVDLAISPGSRESGEGYAHWEAVTILSFFLGASYLQRHGGH